jgi:hypothetical protein
MKRPDSRNPVRTFVLLCVISAVGLGAYFYWMSTKRLAQASNPPAVVVRPTPEVRLALPEPPEKPPISPVAEDGGSLKPAAPRPAFEPREILFRYNALNANYGKLAALNYPGMGAPRFIDGLACETLHFAGDRGICLRADRGVMTTYTAVIFDSTFKTLFSIPLQGAPSRCRVSPDGKLAAFTVFLSGHSYASVDFTTQTMIVDTTSGKVLANLEDFAVTRDGQAFKEQDFNFWGVTFTPDSKRFYCTLSSNRKHYLVEGDVELRAAKVIHENVECPSVSPSGALIAYKKRLPTPGRIEWQLHILDTAAMRETPLAEKRSVDDQIEWLDEESVLYALPENPTVSSASTNVWRALVDGKTPPAIFLRTAYSAVAVR